MVAVHVRSCHTAGKRRRGISQEEARRALAGNIEAASTAAPTMRWGGRAAEPSSAGRRELSARFQRYACP
ncbi:DUF6233 domain-containing protein [Streptomyces sp. NPDC000151]|uniref:DUF6233 domain-containing protein n=1 Tax=Streptomyces sp. NPDC000151 TaxID=3154244 RepID=UPI003328FB9E